MWKRRLCIKNVVFQKLLWKSQMCWGLDTKVKMFPNFHWEKNWLFFKLLWTENQGLGRAGIKPCFLEHGNHVI